MPYPLFETMITSLVSPETAFEWNLLHRFWRMLADTGTPVSPDALAQALHCPREKVLETLRLYPEAEYDPAGNLAGLSFTLHQTRHQLLLGERTFYGWCAPDVLVFPVVLGCTARIVSTCPVTGTGIQLTVKEAGLRPVRLGDVDQISVVDHILWLWFALATAYKDHSVALKVLTH